MFLFLFISIFANLAMGFCAAVAVRVLIQNQPAVMKVENSSLFLAELEASQEDEEEADEFGIAQSTTETLACEIPSEYLKMLETESIEAKSLVEATAQVLRLEIGVYRAKLIDIENRVRENWANPSEDVLIEITDDLDALNVQWLDSQAEATGQLETNLDGDEQYGDVAQRLSDTLFEQTAQIETTLSNLQQADFNDKLEKVCKMLLLEISRLMDLCHDLRDKMTETIVTILRIEKRLSSLDKGMKVDSLTGLQNRTGIECILQDWWRADIRKERILSIAIVDIDRFRKLNDRLSTEIADKLLSAVGRYVADLMRSDRNCEKAMRLDGQRFLLFFGDLGPRGATSAVERIRQTIMATAFEYQGQEIEVRASAGVVEAMPGDSTSKLISRAMTAVRTAKKNGRDRTFIDEGNGCKAIEPPAYPVDSRVVRIT